MKNKFLIIFFTLISISGEAISASDVNDNVTEDMVISGNINASDVDFNDEDSLVFSTDSTAEGLTLNSDGSYVFDASSYDTLSLSETLLINVSVTATDDQDTTNSTTLKITITGTNDDPIAQASAAYIMANDTQSGTISASDVDLPSNESLIFTTSSNEEGLTLNTDGSYIFDSSYYEDLPTGESETLSIPITVTDDQGATDNTILTIYIFGTNDDPVTEDLLLNIDIDSITGDSYINSDEASQDNLTITGSFEGDSYDTYSVEATINDNTYSGTLSGSVFTISGVSGSDLENDSDGVVDVTVWIYNDEGASGSASSTESYFVDTSSRTTLTVYDIDDIDDSNVDSYIEITGRVGFDGESVTAFLGGDSYEATMSSGAFSILIQGSIMAEYTSITITAYGEDSAGNTSTKTSVESYSVNVTEETEADSETDTDTETEDDSGSDSDSDTGTESSGEGYRMIIRI